MSAPPEAIKIKISLPVSSELWSPELLNDLRLCRNRAYSKVASKRRSHLPASLSIFLHKEWMSLHPEMSVKPRELMEAYCKHFTSSTTKRRRGPYPGRRPLNSSSSHCNSDKQWSDDMLRNLSIIGDKVDELALSDPHIDYTSQLKKEWVKFYPDSTLTGRNLKARLFLYKKTRPESSANKKAPLWNRSAEDLLVKLYLELTEEEKSPSCLGESLYELWKKYYTGPLRICPENIIEKVQDMLEKEPETFVAQFNDRKSNLHVEEFVSDDYDGSDKSPSVPSLPPPSEWACKNHWIHIFSDESCEKECLDTTELIRIRSELKPYYPHCDIFDKPYRKQPRRAGLPAAILEDWNRLHPDSEETVKTLVARLLKYDGVPIEDSFHKEPKENNNEGVKIKSNRGRIAWSQEMVSNLRESRKYAEAKAQENVNRTPAPQAITKIWKNRWKFLYPDLQIDWKVIVNKYNSHFADPLSSQDYEEMIVAKKKEMSDDDSEVKGFRNWNASMKQGLIDTKEKILKSLYPERVDIQSKQFASMLFNEFRKSFPKCMESTRSLLLRLQSIEKEGFTPSDLKDESHDVENEKPRILAPITLKIKASSFIKTEEKVNGFQSSTSSLPSVRENVTALSSTENLSPITGFSNWTLSMIRDFIACMDIARRKYASLKDDQNQVASGGISQQPPRLIPLLLNEWKEIYPASKETIKTFLEKIKHLKLQKEVIKKHLSQSGLLPKREGASNLPVANENEEKVKIEEEFHWDKSMITDVIKTREIALNKQLELQNAGEKASFHTIWAEEFRKIYPTSYFTSNNLSVHFWSWKKSKKKGLIDKRVHTKTKPAAWSRDDRLQLLEIGTRVQEILHNPNTPEDIKVRGFSSLLYNEWKLARPDRSDHPRILNISYHRFSKSSKNKKLNDEELQEKNPKYENCNRALNGETSLKSESNINNTKWTPKHNRVLRQCVLNNQIKGETDEESIINSWRKAFPKSLTTDRDVSSRISDIISEQAHNKVSLPIWALTSEIRKFMDRYFTTVIRPKLGKKRLPKDCLIAAGEEREIIAAEFHKELIKKFPDCPLSPEDLLSDFESLRRQSMKRVTEEGVGLRTWTPSMIKDMMETRKIALQKRKNLPNPELYNLAETWYQEFRKLHPEYKSTKRNLIRKYKWYKSRTSKTPHPKFEKQNFDKGNIDIIRMKSVRKDLLQHVKSLLEESRIFLPHKLPPMEEIMEIARIELVEDNSEETNPVLIHEEESTNSDEGSFKLPGGATLVALTEDSTDANFETNDFERPQVTITIRENEAALAYKEEKDKSEAVQTIKIPVSVQGRLRDLGLSLKDFHKLLIVYDESWLEYVRILKRGYLAFFPFILQIFWLKNKEESVSNKKVTGRKLVGLVEMFLDDFYRRNERSFPPQEFLSKVPCKYVITELTLKQILVCFSEISSTGSLHIDVEAHERWRKRHPEISLSFKELVSLHRMLVFENDLNCQVLRDMEVDCAISDIWSKHVRVASSSQDSSSNTKLEEAMIDDDNVPIDKLTEWYYKTKYIPVFPNSSSRRPRFAVKNIKLYWTLDRISDLANCLFLAYRRYRSFKIYHKYKRPYIFDLLSIEWKRIHPTSNIDGRILLAKYISYLRRNKREKNWEENLIIQEWNSDVQAFLSTENITTEEKDVTPLVEEDDNSFKIEDVEEEEEVVSAIVFTDEDVLQRIDERNAGRKSAVWTSSVMRDLLKARNEGRRRKKEWEKRTVDKYDSSDATYCNPQVKIKKEKVDHLFQEEWIKMRPKLAHLSIWTLNAYARKFDQFKKQLSKNKKSLTKKNEELFPSKPLPPPKYFPNTSVLEYDINAVDKLNDVSHEVKDLLVSRQLAMEAREVSGRKLTLKHLWPIEWKKRTGKCNTGHQLMTKLWSVERFSSNMNRLCRAWGRNPVNRTLECSINPVDNFCSMPILPRRCVFLEDEILRSSNKLSHQIASKDSSFTSVPAFVSNRKQKIVSLISVNSESLFSDQKKSYLEIPSIVIKKQVNVNTDEETDIDLEKSYDDDFYSNRLCPKRRKLMVPNQPFLHEPSSLNSDSFRCDQCGKELHNINNFHYHTELHS